MRTGKTAEEADAMLDELFAFKHAAEAAHRKHEVAEMAMEKESARLQHVGRMHALATEMRVKSRKRHKKVMGKFKNVSKRAFYVDKIKSAAAEPHASGTGAQIAHEGEEVEEIEETEEVEEME